MYQSGLNVGQVLGVCKLKVRDAIPETPDAKPVRID